MANTPYFTKAESQQKLKSAFAGGDVFGLNNKKWTSYGDSITAAGSWQNDVLSKLSMSHYKRGIGGTTVVEIGSTAYVNTDGSYAARPPDPQPAGTTEILSSLCNQQRIDTIPLDTEIITVMAGTNDYGREEPIGTIDDTVNTTFMGAFQIMLEKIYARIPDAEIIIATPIHRIDDYTRFPAGYVFEDFRTAIRQIANKYKYKLVEMDRCGINQFNHTKYLADGIHPNAAGAERMSRVFLENFKNIY